MTFTDENGKKYEIVDNYKGTSEPYERFVIKPIKEAEKQWEVTEPLAMHRYYDWTINVNVNATKAQAEVVVEAIKALLEYVHDPSDVKAEGAPFTWVKFERLAMAARKAVRGEA